MCVGFEHMSHDATKEIIYQIMLWKVLKVSKNIKLPSADDANIISFNN